MEFHGIDRKLILWYQSRVLCYNYLGCVINRFAVLRLTALQDFNNNKDPLWSLPLIPFVLTLETYTVLIISSLPVTNLPIVKLQSNNKSTKSLSQAHSEIGRPSKSYVHAAAVPTNGHAKWSSMRESRHASSKDKDIKLNCSRNGPFTFHQIPSATNLRDGAMEVPSVNSKNDEDLLQMDVMVRMNV